MKTSPSYPPLFPQLLELLRCGLWDRQPDAALFRGLTHDQWLSLLLQGQQQSILGLMSEGVQRLPEDSQPPLDLRLQWFGYLQAIRHQQRQYGEARQEVLSWFLEAGIRCAVFKGDTFNALYPIPGLRMCGDVDLWFPDPDGVTQALQLLRSKGITPNTPGDHDIAFSHKNLTFEIHQDFLNLPFKSRVPHTLISMEHPVYTGLQLNPEANTVMVLTHAARHFIEMGLGLRHLCDWAVWLHHYGHNPEVQRGLAEIRRLGAGVFLTEFTALAVYLLGVESPDAENLIRSSRETRRERLLREMLLQGNLGKSHSAQKQRQSFWKYYSRAFLRELSLSAFWPRYVWASIPHQIRRTCGMLRRK